jgi:coenzyme F420-0:L-glutamate ligase/coenzyme F420-1:gamma-L-glutamate ligase
VKKEGKELAESLGMDPFLAQLVVDEADTIFSGVQGFALAIKNDVVAPNAGIDRSNVFNGHAILYPRNPYLSAENIRKKILEKTGKKVGIVLSDSRLMPTRIGTTGVALAVAGFNPVKDERGRKDLFGNVLRVTQRALADDLCSAAQLLMGEADEGIPIVIARGTGIKIRDKAINPKSAAVPFSECIYITGLSNQNLIEKMKKIKSRP